jgi:DNA-binding MarR family transcriptional regulator
LEKDAFDLRDFLPYVLTLASENASLGFQRVYKERYGMLRTEWRVLFHLGRYGAMTAREVCDRASLHKTKVSRAVSALNSRRFLTREQSIEDRRHEMLSLTQAGHSAYGSLCTVAQEYDGELAARFSPDEQIVLRRCLGRLAGLHP